jgi:hypothetical protein
MVWEPASNWLEIGAILVPVALLPLLSLLLIRPLVRAQEGRLFRRHHEEQEGTGPQQHMSEGHPRLITSR